MNVQYLYTNFNVNYIERIKMHRKQSPLYCINVLPSRKIRNIEAGIK